MIKQELFTKIKLIGVKSGVLEISYFETDIVIVFYDEYTDVSVHLYSIDLGKFSPIKESYLIGNFDLSRIKNNEEAKAAEKLLMEKGNKLRPTLVSKAKELAEEISQRAGIPVIVNSRLQGTPYVPSEFVNNMWHASQV